MDEDQKLMERLKAGDPDALGQLIGRWRGRAESYAIGILHDPQAAEDAVMEAFSRLYAARFRYEPKCAFGTWFLTVVRRICIDQLRRDQNRPVPMTEIPEIPVDSAENEALKRMTWLDRLSALGNLDETDRRLLLGTALEGCSTRELAGELGLSDGQIRVRLHRIRKRLKKGERLSDE